MYTSSPGFTWAFQMKCGSAGAISQNTWYWGAAFLPRDCSQTPACSTGVTAILGAVHAGPHYCPVRNRASDAVLRRGLAVTVWPSAKCDCRSPLLLIWKRSSSLDQGSGVL